MADVAVNYQTIIGRLHQAAAKVGRDAREIKLLAAAKSQSVDPIRAAIAAGGTGPAAVRARCEARSAGPARGPAPGPASGPFRGSSEG